ncbi:MAG TPA: 4-hydroxy-tetrahydrodipicolinate reductase [Burkholderiales bacterium]|nr:4-hydroxy-tetrahydrodipicolinate reductase [Burkholderiales bacterium]
MNVAIAGSCGRMGRMLLESVSIAQDLRLHAALEQSGHPQLGTDAGELIGSRCGVTISSDVEAALKGADVLIDFTRPEGTLAHLSACRRLGVKMVIGTTGFDEAQRATIAAAGRDIAIVFAPNMSVGVNVMLKLLSTAAAALGDAYDVEIVEAHHKHKVDAPSGTALKMGEVIARSLGRSLADCAVYDRHGITGERRKGTIGFAALRGGDLVGDHTALFAGIGERIEITHRAASRATYAQGAIRAARFLMAHKSGCFDMHDVLALK